MEIFVIFRWRSPTIGEHGAGDVEYEEKAPQICLSLFHQAGRVVCLGVGCRLVLFERVRRIAPQRILGR